MFPFALTPTYKPDLMIRLDASHAEAFQLAASTASIVMEASMQNQSALGVLKAQNTYLVGRMEFSNATVVDSQQVDDFAESLIVAGHKANVLNLRNQLTGHIKAAMGAAIDALSSKTLTLAFFKGGPVFVVPPKGGNDKKYRLAVAYFTRATTMDEENLCVNVNRSARATYREVWNILSKLAPPPSETDNQAEDHEDNVGPDMLDRPEEEFEGYESDMPAGNLSRPGAGHSTMSETTTSVDFTMEGPTDYPF